MDTWVLVLLAASALSHVTTADVIALAVGSDIVVKDASDFSRTPCGEPNSYIPTGATFDAKNNVVYWVGRRQSWVGVANMDMGVAKLQRKIYTDQISDGYDIDYDMTSGLLYIAAKEGLIVMDTNGTESVRIVKNGPGAPKNVAVDPIGRHIYWSDREASVIWRANLDGRGRHAIYFESKRAASVTVDVLGRRLYWTEDDVIFSSTLNGTDVISVKNPSKERIVQLVVKGDFVYFATNWRVFKANKWDVLRRHLHNNLPEVVTRANCMELRTLAVHSPEPIKSNWSKCMHKNGGCFKLCIPLQGGITCASKREIMHVPDKMEAAPPPPGTEVDEDDGVLTDIDILYEKETEELKVVYPVIVVVVVVLTIVLIVVITCYWKKVRKEQNKKLIWDIQSIGDLKPGERHFRLYMEDDILDNISLGSKSMEA